MMKPNIQLTNPTSPDQTVNQFRRRSVSFPGSLFPLTSTSRRDPANKFGQSIKAWRPLSDTNLYQDKCTFVILREYWNTEGVFSEVIFSTEIVECLCEEQFSLVYLVSDRRFQGIREPYFSAQPPESIQTHLIVCVHGLDGKHFLFDKHQIKSLTVWSQEQCVKLSLPFLDGIFFDHRLKLSLRIILIPA